VRYVVNVAGAFDPTQQCYYHIETPTFYTPIVSQSDYYTQVLADDAAKKLIAQQMSVRVVLLIGYFNSSNCNLY